MFDSGLLKAVLKMEILLVDKSGVTQRGNAQVPPPMELVAESEISMEYKWSVVCYPEVTQQLNNGDSAAGLSQIEHMCG